MPAIIEKLEAELEEHQTYMTTPKFYTADGDTIVSAQDKLAKLERELESAYARWEELEAMLKGVELE
ncbi:hypothetical protein [Pseudodesulfovibrio tunisiensis]|uniref:hypothetical protein n=1 Tax=Pseudodesulfovibrio tunisiensis TaxID=463192 RepID=UPI00311F477F